MAFGSFRLFDQDYPLGHLDHFDVTVPAKDPLERPAVLRVSFSHHVFSVKWDGGKHTEEHQYAAGGETRAFCSVRYGCSIELRTIIEYHIAGKAYLSKDNKGNLRHMFYAAADGIQYPVFFNLAKANRVPGVDGMMHVISAYQKKDLPAKAKFQSIKFARLVHQKCPPKAT